MAEMQPPSGPRKMIREYSIAVECWDDGMGQIRVMRENGGVIVQVTCPQKALPQAAGTAVEAWLSEVVRLLDQRLKRG